uniref:Uncharacterized protein n=1 Tax=Arundo donax TaxID=35708 RepID=A0A0A9CP33_ARUDO
MSRWNIHLLSLT